MNNLVRPLSVESKNALLQRRLSLACSEIRSRNDEAINCTRNRIYSLKVFHSLPLDIYFLFFSELIQYARQRLPEYVCGRRLYAGTDKYTKIQGPRFQKNYIFARDQKGDLHGTSFQSSPKINRMLMFTMKVYNTRPVSLAGPKKGES